MNKLRLFLVVLLSSIALPAFAATTIGFDDLAHLSTIPNGYNGLNWDNFLVFDGTQDTTSGYFAGIVSPNNVAFNGFGDPSVVSDGTFDLTSGYFTAAWNDNLQLQVIGSFNGNPLYNQTYTLSATAPTLINLNYMGVDSVQFISTGGTPHPGYDGSGTQFAVDNLVINGSIPEPSSVALLVVGLGAAAGFARRKLRR